MTQAREGFPTAAQGLLSFLRLVAELRAKEGVFLQSTDMSPHSGRTSAPIIPQRVHTMRRQSARTGVSSGSQSVFIIAL
jgi:hypothetical protein